MKIPVLQVENLRITRSGIPILKDINWQIEAGENWVILGANGSGKTSLLAALTGYLMPTAGAMHVLGQRYGFSDWRELRKAIGIVSSSIRQMMQDEELALWTVASGREAIVDLPGKLHREIENDARRILYDLDCLHLADRRWEVLSQGERQRILIGRALMARPKLLILDEPCAGLDPIARADFLKKINALSQIPDAPALVLVTHHIEEIGVAFTHVLLLREGEVLAQGPKKTVLCNSLLEATFGQRVEIFEKQDHYSLEVCEAESVAIPKIPL